MVIIDNLSSFPAGTVVTAVPTMPVAAAAELTSSTTTSCFDMGIIRNWLKKSSTIVMTAKRSRSPRGIIGIGLVTSLLKIKSVIIECVYPKCILYRKIC